MILCLAPGDLVYGSIESLSAIGFGFPINQFK